VSGSSSPSGSTSTREKATSHAIDNARQNHNHNRRCAHAQAFHPSRLRQRPAPRRDGLERCRRSGRVHLYYADGTSKSEVHFSYVFTSAATGKSIRISGSDESSATATENGDGTITFVFTFKGLPQKLSIPNGPTLTRDAGNVTITQTFDEATGDLISQVISPLHGPHPSLADPNLFCDVIVPALT
jgi:hypothetical protein